MRCPICKGNGHILLHNGYNPIEKRPCKECEGTGSVKRFINEFVSDTALSTYLQTEPHTEYRLAGMTADKEYPNCGILAEGYKLIWERVNT